MAFALTVPPTAGSAPDHTSDAYHLSLFGEVWQTVKDHFFDPGLNGVDWNDAKRRYGPLVAKAGSLEETARLINAMLAELKTSHTHFYTRLDTAYYYLFDLFNRGRLAQTLQERFPAGVIEYVGIGILTVERDGETFIKGVLDGGPADRAGLRMGHRIVSVGGEPFRPIESFVGKANRPVSIVVQTHPAEERVVRVTVTPERISPAGLYREAMMASVRLIERGGKTVGYIHVWSYAGEQYHQLLRSAVIGGPLSGADALIVDLRDGWGGAQAKYLNLFNQRIPHMTMIGRGRRVGSAEAYWRKPVVMLINEGTRSGKEIIAYGFQKYEYGKLVGSRTAGAVTAGRMYAIGKDAGLYLAVMAVQVDGHRLEGVGVTPDVEVPFDVRYANGRDPQLEAAIDQLLKTLRSTD